MKAFVTSIDSDAEYRRDEAGVFHRAGFAGIGYSDGADTEQSLLHTLQTATDLGTFSPELSAAAVDWPSEAHLSRERANLLRPFPIGPGHRVLEIGAGCGALTRYLGETGANVDALEGSFARAACAAARVRDLPNVAVYCEDASAFVARGAYDVVTLIGVLEYARLFFPGEDRIAACLEHARAHLRPGGTLLLAIENQLGLKYLNGCNEDHVGAPFAGICDLYGPATVVTFGRRELEGRLVAAGFASSDWYYPYPDYKLPSIVVSAAAARPDSGFSVGDLLFGEPSRDYSGRVLRSFDESSVWPVLQRNGLIPDFANSFLVAASTAGPPGVVPGPGWLAEKYTSSRTPQFATVTRFSALGAGRIVVDKLPLPADRPGRHSPEPELAIVHRRHRADYLRGRVFAQEFARSVAQGLDLPRLASTLTPWISLLLAEARRVHPAATNTPWSQLTVPGELVDCVPFNLLLEADGTLQVIDDEFAIEGEIPLPWVVLRGIVHTANRTFGQRALADITLRELVRQLLHHLGLADLVDWTPYCELENRMVRTVLAPWSGRDDRAPFQVLLDQPVAGLRSLHETLAAREVDLARARNAVDALRNWLGGVLGNAQAETGTATVSDDATLRDLAATLATVLGQPAEGANWHAALRVVERGLLENAHARREITRTRVVHEASERAGVIVAELAEQADRQARSIAAEREWAAAMVVEVRQRVATLQESESMLRQQVAALEAARSSEALAAAQTIDGLRQSFDAAMLAQQESERAAREAHAMHASQLELAVEAERRARGEAAEMSAREMAAQRDAHAIHASQLELAVEAERRARSEAAAISAKEMAAQLQSRSDEAAAMRSTFDATLATARRQLELEQEQIGALTLEVEAARQAFAAGLVRAAETEQLLRERASVADSQSRAAAERAARLESRLDSLSATRWYRWFGPRLDPGYAGEVAGGRPRRALFGVMRGFYRKLPVPASLRLTAKDAFYTRFGFLFRHLPNYQIWHTQRATATRLVASPSSAAAPAFPMRPLQHVSPDAADERSISVVIPAYGKAEMTRQAIASLRGAGAPQPLEIIVVDDGSPEPLADALAGIDGVRVVRNASNLGFVGTCNRGAAEATGHYLLFLNNDTEVQPDALTALWNAITTLPDAGAVGAKLVFPDGRLQEAGAYLRPDGSAEMVGLWDDPQRPRYNFTREVGYCSGACLLIERDLFATIGGFDPEFAPAYCEDSDLCYRVRRAGRRVYYEPRSVVHHRLSASMQDSPIDKAAVIATNQRKFLQRWQSTLQAEDASVRAIALYLPQYHPIPENDAWWGNGFTEWTNVSAARPQFPGHVQPNLPADLGFYDLRLPEPRARQAELARAAGIHGFCYYTYWFAGTRLLNAPLDAVVASGAPDFPFCLCWANENWTRRWDGLDSEILIDQHHSAEDDLAFFDSILPALRDRRYIKVDGRPLLLVYRPGLLPDAAATAGRWRQRARECGLGEIYLVSVQSFFHLDPTGPHAYGFDAAAEFPPHSFAVEAKVQPRGFPGRRFEGKAYDYVATREQFLAREMPAFPVFRGVMPRWDNSARRGNQAGIFVGATPAEYEDWLRRAVAYTKSAYFGDERLVFVNAWNEWGEGNYLEPDRQFGHAYLDATRRGLGLAR